MLLKKEHKIKAGLSFPGGKMLENSDQALPSKIGLLLRKPSFLFHLLWSILSAFSLILIISALLLSWLFSLQTPGSTNGVLERLLSSKTCLQSRCGPQRPCNVGVALSLWSPEKLWVPHPWRFSRQTDLVIDLVVGIPVNGRRLEICYLWDPYQSKPFDYPLKSLCVSMQPQGQGRVWALGTK